MAQINAYITFNGQCREAMNFYKECLDAELVLQTVGESPMADQWPPAMAKHVLHSCLTKDNLLLMGSDMSAEPLVIGNTISLSLNCSTEEEMESFFSKLSAGGNVTHPIHDFFAGKLAALTDKYGVSWLFYYNNNDCEQASQNN